MGIFNFFQEPNASMPIEYGQPRRLIFAAHVIEVCLDPTSPLYENPIDIGKIKYRDLYNITPFTQKTEQDLVTVAWPMDRASMRYPLPGEQVFIYEGYGDVLLPFTNTLQRISFYTFNVNTTHNVTFNSVPFLQSNQNMIERGRRIDLGVAVKRFEKKLQDDSKFVVGGEPKIYPQLKPLEGDFILQGRFGNSIRLGSTSKKEYDKRTKGPNETAAANWSTVGAAGDPIIVMRVNKEPVDNPDSEEAYVMEDPTVDQSSFYLCSSQNVPVLLACTTQMKSWKATYDIGPDTKLEKMETDSKLYEQIYSKVVEMDKDVHDQINEPPKGDPTQNAADQANTPFVPNDEDSVESNPTEAEAAPSTEDTLPDTEATE